MGLLRGGSCTTNVVLCPYGVGLWKSIRRGWAVIPMPCSTLLKPQLSCHISKETDKHVLQFTHTRQKLNSYRI